jgi:hypothetical protein
MRSIIFNIQDSSDRNFYNVNNSFTYENKKYDYISELYDQNDCSYSSCYILTWSYKGKEHQILFPTSSMYFFVDPISNLIVCSWFILDEKLTHTTYFFNLDGTINHKLMNPEVVYCRLENELKIPYKPLVPSTTDDMTQIGSFPVEDIPATMDFDEELNSLVGQYYYIYDWVLYRKYDALRQEWGDIVGHSGHAG